jgi:branched-subunit amino acid transport protein
VAGEVALLDNPKIPAFIIAMVAAALTRNVLVTISTGMIALWLIRAFLS